MTESTRNYQGRSILLLLLALCAVPFLAALLLYSTRFWMLRSIHHGNLITPAMPANRGDFVGFDHFSKTNIGELRGHWVLVQFIGPHGCGAVCRESLEKTRQVRLMLSKDLLRVRRLAVVMAEISLQQANDWWLGHPYLLRARANEVLERIAKTAAGSEIPEGAVFIMDPIGNFMMWYPAGFDPYGLKKDMQRLLQVSQIG